MGGFREIRPKRDFQLHWGCWLKIDIPAAWAGRDRLLCEFREIRSNHDFHSRGGCCLRIGVPRPRRPEAGHRADFENFDQKVIFHEAPASIKAGEREKRVWGLEGFYLYELPDD